MRAVIRRYPLTAFVVLACLFGWSIWIGVFLSGGSGGINLPIAPIIAALIVASCQGRAELRAWARRLRSWRADPKWYLLAVLAPVVLHVLIVLVNGGLGAPLPTSDQLSHWPDVPGTFLVLLVLIGIGEEAGWTAFMAPILLRRHGLLVAWAIASVVRILWHVPLMISGDLDIVLGIVGNAAFTMVLLALLVVRGGNWSLAAVWHASLNAAGGSFFFTMVDGADATRLSLLMSVQYAFVAVLAYLAVRGQGPRHTASTDASTQEVHMSTDTRQRTYDWDDPAPTAFAGLDQDGLSVLRAIGAGTLPLPPAVRTLGIEPVEADPGRVTFRLDLGEFHLNPFGIVHGGVLAAVKDTAMGCAVHSLLPPAVGYVTGELNVRFLRPALLAGGPLVCTGQVDHQGRSTMIASARIVDSNERVIAIGGATCLVRRS